MAFVGQIEGDVGPDIAWIDGSAYLFICPPGCLDRRGELVIQTT